MESDALTPVLTVMVLVIVTAILLRWRSTPPLPGGLSWSGSVELDDSAFAHKDEARRDLCRAFCADGIYVQQAHDGRPPELLPPPIGLQSGIQKEELDAQYDAFSATLLRRCSTHPLTLTELERLVAHLSVSPTISVLAAVGVPPMLLQNRFVLHFSTDGSLRVFTLGYVGTPIAAARPADKHAPFVLAVSSPDLRDSATANARTLACTMVYRVWVARYPKIETELAKVGIAPSSK